jgi:hypothetical protein
VSTILKCAINGDISRFWLTTRRREKDNVPNIIELNGDVLASIAMDWPEHFPLDQALLGFYLMGYYIT